MSRTISPKVSIRCACDCCACVETHEFAALEDRSSWIPEFWRWLAMTNDLDVVVWRLVCPDCAQLVRLQMPELKLK